VTDHNTVLLFTQRFSPRLKLPPFFFKFTNVLVKEDQVNSLIAPNDLAGGCQFKSHAGICAWHAQHRGFRSGLPVAENCPNFALDNRKKPSYFKEKVTQDFCPLYLRSVLVRVDNRTFFFNFRSAVFSIATCGSLCSIWVLISRNIFFSLQ
jgi:hypothetical protein